MSATRQVPDPVAVAWRLHPLTLSAWECTQPAPHRADPRGVAAYNEARRQLAAPGRDRGPRRTGGDALMNAIAEARRQDPTPG